MLTEVAALKKFDHLADVGVDSVLQIKLIEHAVERALTTTREKGSHGFFEL